MSTHRGPATDDATWLAAELDADPATCRAAIDYKLRQAAARGRPWRNVKHMVRSVIPSDEWRALVREHGPKPLQPPTQALCDGADCPGVRHEWTRGRNQFVCMGRDA